jgi:protein phosphatase
LERGIRKAVLRAHEEVTALLRDRSRCGSTLTGILWRGGRELYVLHVGDSRAYQIRDDRVERLTADHTVAQALIAAGTIAPDQARQVRNALYRFLGAPDMDEGPDIRVVTAGRGDRFLVCTDGLSNFVDQADLLRCVRQEQDLQRCAETLVQTALDRGSMDNISCIVLEFPESGAEEPVFTSPTVDARWLSWNDGCVPRLAQSLRDSPQVRELRVLADALEDAGCSDPVILSHCRESGEHIRDCWVLELLPPSQ